MFELVDPESRKKIEAAQVASSAGLGSFQEIGIIVYEKVGDDFSRVKGVFSLPMYRGELAEEDLTKTTGAKDAFDGVYDMVTRTAAGSKFPAVAATGTLTITSMDPRAEHARLGDCHTAHWVAWDFVPAEWLNHANGYAATGIHLQYLGVGIEIAGPDGPRLAVAWTNNMFSRTWTFDGMKMIQYGVCGNAMPVPAPST